MRGKQGENSEYFCELRITPADAGKTRYFVLFHLVQQDHPRGCGENSSFFITSTNISGSPPRMRGKRTNLLSVYSFARITPADAGKTRERD